VDLIENIIPKDQDNLKTLLAFTLINPGESLSLLEPWYFDSYARILYPRAKTDPEQVGKFLRKMGEDSIWDTMLELYLPHVSNYWSEHAQWKPNALLYGGGIPEDLKMPFTAGNGETLDKDKIRIITVVNRDDWYPLCYRHITGDIEDVSTVIEVLDEMAEQNIDVRTLILDTGFYSPDNLNYFYDLNVPFVMRIDGKTEQFKQVVLRYGKDLRTTENAVEYENGILYVHKVTLPLEDERFVYAYVSLDIKKQAKEDTKTILKALRSPTMSRISEEELRLHGKFILISSNNLTPSEAALFFGTRRHVEQIFKVFKGSSELLPTITHPNLNAKGALTLSFLASALNYTNNVLLEGSGYSAKEAFSIMNKLKIQIYDTKKLIQEPTIWQKEILNKLNITIPYSIQKSAKGPYGYEY
jgi:transposase